jgi:hypothetical protein
MPLIKLNRINKGGEIFINSDYILYMEMEYRTTTVHMLDSLLFSVEDPLQSIMETIERTEAGRISLGIKLSGLAGPQAVAESAPAPTTPPTPAATPKPAVPPTAPAAAPAK